MERRVLQFFRNSFLCLALSLAMLSGAAGAQETAEQMQAQLQVLYEMRPSVTPVRVYSYAIAEGTFQLGMQGTDLARGATGELRIRSRVNYNEIDLRVKGLPAAQSIGAEFLTYVVWAISPSGLGTNLGELSLERGEGRLRTQTDLQSFGVIVTAEPFYATTMPSDTVVLENVTLASEKRSPALSSVETRFIPRGQYKVGAEMGEVKPFTFEAGIPLDIYQARNALLIGKRTGTDRFVPEGYQSGQALLAKAEELYYGGDTKASTAKAREAVQVMGDAIQLSLERQEKLRSDLISRAADDRVRRATATAEDAERRMKDALQKQAAAEKATREAEQKRASAEDAMRLAVEERRRAQQEAIEAREVAQKLVQEQRQLRDLLVERLNQVLSTEDTDRGLVVKLSDILFDPGKFTLKPETKVLLARIAGILSWAPGITVQVEGHTDNTGDAAKNQQLSEQRAAAVGNFLVEQGMPASNISSVGYGESRPIAPNNTREGRDQNRRVELVLSGEMIGARVGGSGQP